MITTRNNLPAKLMPTDKMMLDEIDAVYEISRAEFPSIKKISDQAYHIIKTSGNPEARLASFFLSHVKDVAKRDGLMAGVPEENFVSVANQVGQDWDATMGADYRREQESANPAL